ncbi:MAG: RNA-protein complex protein Nop10 [Thermoprotei archaeon]
MKWKLRRCPKCGLYTFQDKCPTCRIPTIVPHPPRFSPVDKYVKYRIELKKGVKLEC